MQIGRNKIIQKKWKRIEDKWHIKSLIMAIEQMDVFEIIQTYIKINYCNNNCWQHAADVVQFIHNPTGVQWNVSCEAYVTPVGNRKPNVNWTDLHVSIEDMKIWFSEYRPLYTLPQEHCIASICTDLIINV